MAERRRWAGPAVGALLLTGLGACTDTAGAPPASPPTSRPAERIVTLNGDSAEIVFALGLGAEVVGTDTSATFPAEAVGRPKVGYQRQLSAEGILSLNPTVAIGSSEAGPPEVLDQ